MHYSNRIIMIEMTSFNGDINLIKINAPTIDENYEEFHIGIEMILKYFNRHDLMLLLGDFNVKVRVGKGCK